MYKIGDIMSLRSLWISLISAGISTVSAIIFWEYFISHNNDNSTLHGSIFNMWDTVIPQVIFGSFFASIITLIRGKFTIYRGFIFIILCDLLTILSWWLTWIAKFIYQASTSVDPNGPPDTSSERLVFTLLFTLVGALTVGNVVSKGVGFVMAVPSLLWLWLCRQTPSLDAESAPR
jgi:hypothetical protein